MIGSRRFSSEGVPVRCLALHSRRRPHHHGQTLKHARVEDQQKSNWYAYSPYGESQSLGPDDGNPLQYTGRENDDTGLYYYRARYYDPVLKRFVSEDPIGLMGGAEHLHLCQWESDQLR